METRIWLFMIISYLAVFFPIHGENQNQQERTEKKVLILHSYHYGNAWSDSITEGILFTLKASQELDIEIDAEFLDFIRFDKPEYQREAEEILRTKYKHSRYDLIIAVNNHAFKLMVEKGEDIFPGTPFVFCGTLFLQKYIEGIDRPLSGVNGTPDILAGLKQMEPLFPERRNILFLTDLTEPGQRIRKELDRIISNYSKEGYSYRILQDYSQEELLQVLSNLGDDDIVYLTIFARDNQWNYYQAEDSVRFVCETVGDVPVFSTWDFTRNFGITGGYLLDGPRQGALAAEKGLRILQGEKIEDAGIIWESPHTFVFDYPALKKYGIPLKQLPEGTLLLHQPQGIFYKYKAEIIALVSFIAILFVLLLSLLWMNFELRVLKRALQKERDLLDQKVEERTKSIKTMQKKVILRERQAAVGSMLAGMAHEMNTPIGVAITALSHVISKTNEKDAQIIRGEFTSEEAARFMQECGESVDMAFDCLSRAAKLIDEFKTLAPQGSLSDLADFDIFSFLTDIKNAYSKQLQAQGISFSIQGTHIVLTSYPGLIYRIMTSLILNSIEHGFPPDWINTKQIEMTCDQLDWSGTDTSVVIRYRDNGRGIPPDISERIFEPFTTTNRNKGKIGLGLHKVYKLVTEELMGTIEYSACPKGGTQFTIYLPVSDLPEQSF